MSLKGFLEYILSINRYKMNIIQLQEVIGNYAMTLTNVNSFTLGDIYTNLNSKEIRYANVNLAIESIEEYEEHQVYNAIIYYGDRLVEGGNNKYQVQTEAVRLLKDIVKHLRGINNVDVEKDVTYQLFEQEFADYLAGAYCRVRIEDATELCPDE